MIAVLRQCVFATFRCLRRARVWRLPAHLASWRAHWDFARTWYRRQWAGKVWPAFRPVLPPEDEPVHERRSNVAIMRVELEALSAAEQAAIGAGPPAAREHLAMLRSRAMRALLARVSAFERELAGHEGVQFTGQVHGLRQIAARAAPPDGTAPQTVERAREVFILLRTCRTSRLDPGG